MNGDAELARIFKSLGPADLFELVLIAAAALMLIGISQKVLPWIANRIHGRARYYLLAAIPLLRLLILITAMVLAIPILIEPSLQNMVAVLGTLGLAIGFALKDYASSLIAGVVSVFELPYRPGDWIEIDGIYGEVSHVGMRVVEIVTPGDTRVSIPHLKLWTAPVHNSNNGGPSLMCIADFFLHPDHDGVRVCNVLQEVALTSPYLQLDQPVAVLAEEQPWGTRYRVKAYPVDPCQQFRFRTDLTVRGREALRRLGVSPCGAPVSAA